MPSKKKPDTFADDYEIGFGKPPKEFSFKKGESGNPNGRPKKPRQAVDDIYKVISRPVSMKKDGVLKKVPLAEALMVQMVQAALKGDPRSRDRVLDICESFDDRSDEVQETSEEEQEIQERRIKDLRDFYDLRAALVELGLFELDDDGRTRVRQEGLNRLVGKKSLTKPSPAMQTLLSDYLVGTKPP